MSIKLSPKYGVNPTILTCFWCGEDTGIALLGKLKDDVEAPRKMCSSYDPCEKCVTAWSVGYAVIEVNNEGEKIPTGNMVVISHEARERIGFPETEHNMCYVEVGVLEKLGFNEV